jgi:hypothetical protein
MLIRFSFFFEGADARGKKGLNRSVVRLFHSPAPTQKQLSWTSKHPEDLMVNQEARLLMSGQLFCTPVELLRSISKHLGPTRAEQLIFMSKVMIKRAR